MVDSSHIAPTVDSARVASTPASWSANPTTMSGTSHRIGLR